MKINRNWSAYILQIQGWWSGMDVEKLRYFVNIAYTMSHTPDFIIHRNNRRNSIHCCYFWSKDTQKYVKAKRYKKGIKYYNYIDKIQNLFLHKSYDTLKTTTTTITKASKNKGDIVIFFCNQYNDTRIFSIVVVVVAVY